MTNIINLLLNIPATTQPAEVTTAFAKARYKAEVPPGGIMPASTKRSGKHIVNCAVSNATYQQILDVTSAQRPVWQIFGAQDLNPSPNPDYDPEDELSPPTITVVYKSINAGVWNFVQDRVLRDFDGNQTGTMPWLELHNFQGATPWPAR